MNLVDVQALREHADAIVHRHTGRGILIDTNLLVLYLVGLMDPARIRSYPKTEVFSLAEFRFVQGVAAAAAPLLTTPAILNELSHLCEKLPASWVQILIPQLEVWEERHVPSLESARDSRFAKLGFADMSILRIAGSEGCLVVTNDARLTLALEAMHVDVINVQRLLLFW